jgi:hypothetical protein
MSSVMLSQLSIGPPAGKTMKFKYLREEHGMRMFEPRVHRIIYGHKREELTGG